MTIILVPFLTSALTLTNASAASRPLGVKYIVHGYHKTTFNSLLLHLLRNVHMSHFSQRQV